MQQSLIFIKKEIKEIAYSKRILSYLLFACFYCLLLNVVASLPFSTPMFSMDVNRMIKSLNYICAMLSSDIIFVSMVEEMHYKTIDLLYISSLSKSSIIFLKTVLSTILSFCIIYIGILVNNIGSYYMNDLDKISFIDFEYFAVAVLCALGVPIFCFARCLSKAEAFLNTDYISFGFNAIYAFLYYQEKNIGLLPCIILALGLTVFAYLYALRSIHKTKECTLNNKGHSFIVDGSTNKIFYSREWGRFLNNRKALFSLIAFFVCSIVIEFIPYSETVRTIMVLAIYFEVLLNIVLNILLESVFVEKKENMDEILCLAGINKKTNLSYAVKFAGLISCAIFILLFLKDLIFNLFVHRIINWFIPTLCFLIGSLFSISYTGFYSIKIFKTLKDAKILRKNITVITAVVYILICIILFYFAKVII